MQVVFRNISLAITAVATAIWSSAATGTSVRYNCATAAGFFSSIEFSQPGPRYRITGDVAAKYYRTTGRWLPVANVRLVSADKSDFGGIRLQVQNYRGPVEVVVQTRVQGKDRSTIVGTIKKAEFAPFSLEVVDGKMIIHAAGKEFDGPEIGAGGTVHVSCSSGDFLFENLDWDAPKAGG